MPRRVQKLIGLTALVTACQFDATGPGSAGSRGEGGSSGSMATGGDSMDSQDAGDSNDATTSSSSTSDATSTTAASTTAADGPSLEISDAPQYDFGAVDVDADATHSFIVTNVGAADATDLQPQQLTAPYSLDTTTCGTTLGVDETCTVTVTLAPVVFGPFTDSLQIDYGPGTGAAMVDLRGAGGGTTGELVVNGGGEQGGAPPAGWTAVTGDAWSAADFGSQNPSHSGANSIHPGSDSSEPIHELVQDISVSDHATAIDASALRFDFEGWGRSWFSSEDDYRMVIEFRDGQGVIGPPLLDTDWNVGTTWTPYDAMGKAPAGTRSVRVRLLCDLANSICDAFYDDISLTATYEP